MKYFVVSWVSVLALLLIPFAGCSESTNDGAGGEAGAGGGAGSGGDAGSGGGGGSEPAGPGLWTGGGQGGSDGAFTICFNVNEDGTALVRPLNPSAECGENSLDVQFDNDSCVGGLATNEEIPIEDGSFRLLNEQGGLAGFWDISGTFDGNTASGQAEVGAFPDGTCSGSWMATPSQ